MAISAFLHMNPNNDDYEPEESKISSAQAPDGFASKDGLPNGLLTAMYF
jgi:hypothetical protein